MGVFVKIVERGQVLMMYSNEPLGLQWKKRWWVLAETQKCFLANLGWEMNDFQDLQTHLNCVRDLT